MAAGAGAERGAPARDRRQHPGPMADAAVAAGGALPKYAALPPDPGQSGEMAPAAAAAAAAAAAVEGI